MKSLLKSTALFVTFAATPLLLHGAPQTMKDVAVEEARKFDKDHNNKIDGTEAFALRAEFKNNANSHLYMFDENSDHNLDDHEIAKIPLGPPPNPASKPAAAKPAPAPARKSPPASHPHGQPHA